MELEPLEIEYIEKILLENHCVYRIGKWNAGDIQILYYLEERNGRDIVKKLSEKAE